MLPSLRTRLKVPSSKNQALQDIFNSCKYGVEILQVVPFKTKLHNTLITLRVDLGPDVPPEQRHQIRSHFYNRQNIDDLLAEEVFTVSDINQVIAQFNLKGYDFTTDDIEIVNGKLKAKDTSLGYLNSEVQLGCNGPYWFNVKIGDTGANELLADEQYMLFGVQEYAILSIDGVWQTIEDYPYRGRFFNLPSINDDYFQQGKSYLKTNPSNGQAEINLVVNNTNVPREFKWFYFINNDEPTEAINNHRPSEIFESIFIGDFQENPNVSVTKMTMGEFIQNHYSGPEEKPLFDTVLDSAIGYYNNSSPYQPTDDNNGLDNTVIMIQVKICGNPHCLPTGGQIPEFSTKVEGEDANLNYITIGYRSGDNPFAYETRNVDIPEERSSIKDILIDFIESGDLADRLGVSDSTIRAKENPSQIWVNFTLYTDSFYGSDNVTALIADPIMGQLYTGDDLDEDYPLDTYNGKIELKICKSTNPNLDPDYDLFRLIEEFLLLLLGMGLVGMV